MIDIKKLREHYSTHYRPMLQHEELTTLLDELEELRLQVDCMQRMQHDLGEVQVELAQTNRLCEALKRQNRYAIDAHKAAKQELEEVRETIARQEEELELLRNVVELYDEAEGGSVTNEYHEWRAKRGKK